MLHQGKIIADGNADHIRDHQHPAVRNFINGEVSEADLTAIREKGTWQQASLSPKDLED